MSPTDLWAYVSDTGAVAGAAGAAAAATADWKGWKALIRHMVVGVPCAIYLSDPIFALVSPAFGVFKIAPEGAESAANFITGAVGIFIFEFMNAYIRAMLKKRTGA